MVMMYVKYPLSLRNVEDLLFERGIDICHETVRMWWNRFGPLFASDILRQRVSRTPTSTTTSIKSATSSIARPTRAAARPHWPSGRQS